MARKKKTPPVSVGDRVTLIGAGDNPPLKTDNTDYDARIEHLYANDEAVTSVAHDTAHDRFGPNVTADIRKSDGVLLEGVPCGKRAGDPQDYWTRPYIHSIRTW